MKASAFAYARPTSVTDALGLLAAHGDKAKVLSGGQSLMPGKRRGRSQRPAVARHLIDPQIKRRSIRRLGHELLVNPLRVAFRHAAAGGTRNLSRGLRVPLSGRILAVEQ